MLTHYCRTADDKHYMLYRDNLMQAFQLQLSQKQKKFSQFFFAFSKSILNFKHFPKKYDPHSWCISGNTISEKHDEINVSKAVFQRTLRQATWKIGGNTVAIWTTAPLECLLITVKVIPLKKVCFSDIQNRKTVC